MIFRAKKACLRKGFSLTEVMVAAVILAVMAIGTAGYRYYTVLDSRRATMQATAARMSELLCESWRGAKGASSFSPVVQFSSAMSIAQKTAGPEPSEDFTLLGKYRVVINGFSCYATLSWKDDSSGMRILNVATAWPRRGGEGEYMPNPNGEADEYGLFELSTYVVK